jgi:hypothetical protein
MAAGRVNLRIRKITEHCWLTLVTITTGKQR